MLCAAVLLHPDYPPVGCFPASFGARAWCTLAVCEEGPAPVESNPFDFIRATPLFNKLLALRVEWRRKKEQCHWRKKMKFPVGIGSGHFSFLVRTMFIFHWWPAEPFTLSAGRV